MSDFDAEKYWSTRERKAWVVTLVAAYRENRKRKSDRQTLYVTAKTEVGAIRTAMDNAFLRGRLVDARARLATPTDLGCVPARS